MEDENDKHLPRCNSFELRTRACELLCSDMGKKRVFLSISKREDKIKSLVHDYIYCYVFIYFDLIFATPDSCSRFHLPGAV